MLEVIIRGPTNSGKSSLAVVIAKALSEAGVGVEVRDVDIPRKDTFNMSRAEATVLGKRVTITVEQSPRKE